MTIRIFDNEKLMLIDFSYYILYRYYALKSWCKFSKTTLSDQDLLKRFHEKFELQFLKLVKHYDIPPENVIFVGDCKRDTIWRRQIDSEYKSNRDNLSQNQCIVPPSFFEHVYGIIVPEITRKYDNQFVCFDEMEADDVISIICSKCCDSIQMTIITNDNDYLQLSNSNTKIYNLKSLDICSRGTGNPKIDLIMKILTGDVSDNIKCVCSKRIANLLVQKDDCEIEHYIEENGLRTKYDHNRLLIDFSMIPTEYSNKVLSNLEIHNRL